VKSSKERRGRRKKGEVRLPSTLTREDIDEMAKRRCLMLLSVLSGQSTISQAIKDGQISSAMYYQLEARALGAMLEALAPTTKTENGQERSRSFSSLQARVTHLEQEKRRLERLLAMATKIVKPGPMKTAMGRKAKKRTRSTSQRAKKSLDTGIEQDQISTPMTDGAGGP
jgi:hypothetical protein